MMVVHFVTDCDTVFLLTRHHRQRRQLRRCSRRHCRRRAVLDHHHLDNHLNTHSHRELST